MRWSAKMDRACLLMALLFFPGATPVALAQENVDMPLEVELPTNPEPVPGAAGGTGEAEEASELEPWDGTFAGGMTEVFRLAAGDEVPEALALTDRLLVDRRADRLRSGLGRLLGQRVSSSVSAPLTWVGFESMTEADRAELHYVRGLLRARLGQIVGADEELGRARALGGPGETRLDAIYAQGWLDLALAEGIRSQIPEISGQTPAPPQPPAGQGGAPDQAPDTLELARKAYLLARGHFVERLTLDPEDPDTRANTELVIRRLRELDEIERAREEQEQQEEPQEGSPEGEQQENDEAQEGEPEESEGEPSGSEEESEPEPSESEEQGEEGEPSASEETELTEPAEERELEERVLTQEEMMRLLQAFQQYQEQGAELREQNRRVRRERVDRDW